MRNLFDQFDQPENRLTHALMSSLHEDRRLLNRFVKWATGDQAPVGPLRVLEQALPGEEETLDSDELQRRGLPDGWIHDDDCWALVIESKIECRLEEDQLGRHRSTAQRRGFSKLHLLALVVEFPIRPVVDGTKIKKWTDLYIWLKGQEQDSAWARRLGAYMELLETKLSKDGYLKGGTLTVFTGIPFGKNYPYNYHEAKRLLRLAMVELRLRSDLGKNLEIDKDRQGRDSITGKDSTHVWDYLSLKKAGDANNFTEFPHLTVGIHHEYLHAIVIVPNGIRSEFRRNLLSGGSDGFYAIFESILVGLSKSLGDLKGVVPSVEVVQRRYPSQRSEPFIDANLSFDLRTGFGKEYGWQTSPKQQPQWLEAVYSALSSKNSNLQLAVGAKFQFDQFPEMNTRKILDHIADTWLACKPLIQKMIP
jgi:hypothetical protein